MLSVSHFDKDHVDYCRAQIAQLLADYQELVSAARETPSSDEDRLDAAVAAFEPKFCNGLVLVLDNQFGHRARGQEGKDGNPLNEARVLRNSLTDHAGALTADKQIKLDQGKSVTGYAPGDEIVLTQEAFSRLAEGFFDEIERRYP